MLLGRECTGPAETINRSKLRATRMGGEPVRWMMTGKGKPLVEVKIDTLTPGPDEVLVEIAGCGVCHTDLGYYYDGVRTKHDLSLIHI